jgi:hypothetical protein
MWISRNWNDAEAITAWADSFDLSERSRALFGKDLAALAPGELPGSHHVHT